jgi:hypothetical protein
LRRRAARQHRAGKRSGGVRGALAGHGAVPRSVAAALDGHIASAAAWRASSRVSATSAWCVETSAPGRDDRRSALSAAPRMGSDGSRRLSGMLAGLLMALLPRHDQFERESFLCGRCERPARSAGSGASPDPGQTIEIGWHSTSPAGLINLRSHAHASARQPLPNREPLRFAPIRRFGKDELALE